MQVKSFKSVDTIRGHSKIEADSEQEAINQAVELYKKERHTWIDPAFQDAEEIK